MIRRAFFGRSAAAVRPAPRPKGSAPESSARERSAPESSAPERDDESVALSTLPSGSRATLVGDALAEDVREVLRAMGVAGNSPVRVCRQGEPCIVEVRTTRVGLARAIAERLQARPAPTS